MKHGPPCIVCGKPMNRGAKVSRHVKCRGSVVVSPASFAATTGLRLTPSPPASPQSTTSQRPVYDMTDLELRKTLALFYSASPQLRDKLLVSEWERSFANFLGENPQWTLTWKQRRAARQIVERCAQTLVDITEIRLATEGNVRVDGPHFPALADALLRRPPA
jgi:hypothetical protein